MKIQAKTVESQKPQLTSLVDVLTILVVFLLKNYSSEGEILTMNKDLMLPQSTSEEQPKRTLTLAVNGNHIIAEGKPIARTEEQRDKPGMIIPELQEWLANKRLQTDEISNWNDDVEFKGEVTIQGDRKIPFWLLQKVMHTCSQTGYSDFSLAVLQKE